MVAGPYEQALIVSRSNKRQTHQRRMLQVELLLTIAPQKLFQLFLLPSAIESFPVLSPETHFHRSPDYLHRFSDVGPLKAGSEHRMCVCSCLPRLLEYVFVQVSMQFAN